MKNIWMLSLGVLPIYASTCCPQDCTRGEVRCTGSVVETCNSSGKWEETKTCSGATPVCENGACKVCGANQYRCDGDNLMYCNVEQTGFSLLQACEAGTCHADPGKCGCTPGKTRCHGSGVETCSVDGLQWNDTQDCQGTATPYCIEGACRSCVPGAHVCVGQILKECTSDYQVVTKLDCPSGTYCNADRQKCTLCLPDMTKCDGNNVLYCSADGDSWLLLEECGGDMPVCAQIGVGMFGCAPCIPGSHHCSEAELQLCNDSAVFENHETCKRADLCFAEEGSCHPCSYGEKRCGTGSESNVSYVCSEDGRQEIAQACGGKTPVCLYGDCVACKEDQHGCEGDDLMVCNEGSGFGKVVTCPAGTCNAEDGLCGCGAGTERCNGNVWEVCLADGGNWIPQTDCSQDTDKKICVDGECRACVPETYSCAGINQLLHCGADYTNTLTRCPDGKYCDLLNKTCSKCIIGYLKSTKCDEADDSRVLTCSDDGDSWVLSKKCVGSNPKCVRIDDYRADCALCVEGDYRCLEVDGVEYLQECVRDAATGNPKYVKRETCRRVGLCDAEKKECRQCDAGESWCDAETSGVRKYCDSKGLYVGSETCGGETPDCVNGECKACGPGETRCVMKYAPLREELQKCNADSSGWELQDSCGLNMCDPVNGHCNICKEGETVCDAINGSPVVKTCTDHGQGWKSEYCGGKTPYCDGGRCIACMPGDKYCQKDTLMTCNSAQTGYDGHFCGSGLCDAVDLHCHECVSGKRECKPDDRTPAVCENGTWRDETICDGFCTGEGDCVKCADLGDGSGEMCLVAKGSFAMGCNSVVDAECNADEFPYHLVVFEYDYAIDKKEVTVADYGKCVKEGVCAIPESTGYTACNWGNGGRENYPINCISWDEAKKYCSWARKRLPSAAEWERAARGGDGRKYPWGNDPLLDCAHAVLFGCTEGGRSLPVGSATEGISPYGVLDMIGNVSEYVEDCYHDSYNGYPPSDGKAWTSMCKYPGAFYKWEVRGASVSSGPQQARVSEHEASSIPVMYGIRCVQNR